MQRKPNIISLYSSPYHNTDNKENEFIPNTSTTQKYFPLDQKKQYILDGIKNNLIKNQIFYKSNNPDNKNSEAFLKNSKNFRIINKEGTTLINNRIPLNKINKKKIIDLNEKNKLKLKIINGQEKETNKYNNKTIKTKNRNNHSFLESKYILKNDNNFFNTSNYSINTNVNDENINLSNIITNKNLNNKNLKINLIQSNSKKNYLINDSSIKKSQTTFIPISRNNPNLHFNTNNPSIEIDKKSHRIIRIVNHDMEKNMKNLNKEIEKEQKKKLYNTTNSNINAKNNIINQSKSLSTLDIDKINPRDKKSNEKTNTKINEINEPINREPKHCCFSPNTKRKNWNFNKYISVNNISNIEQNHNSRKNQETIETISSNIIQKNSNRNKIIKRSTTFDKNYNKEFQNKLIDKRKNEKCKLNNYEISKNFEHNPVLTEYTTTNRNKNFESFKDKNKLNINILSANNSLIVKTNIDENNSKNVIVKKSNDYYSIPKNNFSFSNVNLTSQNQIEEINTNNNKNINSYNSKGRKINTREKTYLIASKRYELDSKTIDLNQNIHKNNSKKDLTNIPKKSVGNNIAQKINYIKSCSFISISGENDEGNKKINQDSFIIKRNINGILNFNIFGVLDGHGEHGHYASQFVSRFIFNSIKNNPIIKKCSSAEEIYEKITSNNYKLIENIFLDADVQITKEKFDYRTSGTTCVIIIQLNQKIICANAGDSRAIIVYNNGKDLLKESKIFPLSHDFKPDLTNERKRIYEYGGIVRRAFDDIDEDGPYRVYMRGEDFPGLAMSRSIGDIESKKIGIIPNPEFIEYNISEETKYMIICSDGIWEFMSNKKVMEIANEYYLNNDSKGLCKCLYETSVKYWNEAQCYLDDITAIAVFF